jgi:hypothetical protein
MAISTRRLKYIPTTAEMLMPMRATTDGEIQRNKHTDQPRVSALARASHNDRSVAMGESDHVNTEGKEDPTENHDRLAATAIREKANEEPGNDGAHEHGSDDDGECPTFRPDVASR